MRQYVVTLTPDEDGGWVVECPALPGCISQGDTKDEAIRNITDAIREVLASYADEGRPPPHVEMATVDVAA